MAKQDIGKLIYEETEKRLEIMESPDYEFPEKATKKDYIMIAVLIAASISMIVLCMLGVIE